MLDRALTRLVLRPSGGGIVDIYTLARALIEELFEEDSAIRRDQDVGHLEPLQPEHKWEMSNTSLDFERCVMRPY